MSHSYPSDISLEQFSKIEYFLKSMRKKTKPRTVDLYDVFCDIQNVLVDRNYSGEKFAGLVQELLGASVEVAKRNELHTFKVIPKRWVVERSFAWL